eukprot:4434138-Prymnesium_polylepis.1
MAPAGRRTRNSTSAGATTHAPSSSSVVCPAIPSFVLPPEHLLAAAANDAHAKLTVRVAVEQVERRARRELGLARFDPAGEAEGRRHDCRRVLLQRRRREYVGARRPTGAALLRLAEGLHDGDEVLAEVVAHKVALPQHLVAGLEVDVPAQPVGCLALLAPPLDDQAERPRLGPLRRVRNARRQQEDVALVDVHHFAAAAMDDRQPHVAAQLVEELAALLEVEVGPLVRAADEHDAQLLAVQQLVHHGRRERGGMLAQPRGQLRRPERAEQPRAAAAAACRRSTEAARKHCSIGPLAPSLYSCTWQPVGVIYSGSFSNSSCHTIFKKNAPPERTR